MSTNKNKLYVPILKGKMGEFGALRELDPDIRSSILPLIDVPRIKIEDPGGTPAESLEKHLGRVLKHFSQSWPARQPIFVDFYDLDLGLRTSDGTHPLPHLFGKLREENIEVIPVTGLDRVDNGNDDYNRAVTSAVGLDNRGACIRLLYHAGELDDPITTNGEIEHLLNTIGLERSDGYLLLDVRWIEEEDVDNLARIVSRFINLTPGISEWNALILAASGFPENLSGIARNSITRLRRAEYLLWKRVARETSDIARKPIFADYGVVHPYTPDLDPRIVRATAKIRYTIEDEWLVLKGHSLRKEPRYAQFHDLSSELITHPEFLGNEFSWGDDYVAGCATRENSRGNLTTWVKVDTNHHLTFVSEQLSNPT